MNKIVRAVVSVSLAVFLSLALIPAPMLTAVEINGSGVASASSRVGTAATSAFQSKDTLDEEPDFGSNEGNDEADGSDIGADEQPYFGEAASTDETNPPDEGSEELGAVFAPTLANGIYYIRSAASLTRRLDIAGASRVDHGNIQLWSSNKTVAQQFAVAYDAETGYYTITNSGSELAVDVSGGRSSLGANIQQYHDNNTAAQKWLLVPDESPARQGAYTLVSALSPTQEGANKLVADVAGAADSQGTNIRLWSANGTAAQSFYFLSTSYAHPSSQIIRDGIYTFASGVDNDYAVDVPGASDAISTQLNLYLANGTLAQQFYLQWKDGYYCITSMSSGRVFDGRSAGVVPTTALQQYTSNGTAAQRWVIEDNGDGTVSFFAANSGLCVDVQGGNASNNTKIQLYVPNGTNAQKFVLAEVQASIPEGVVSLTPRSDTTKRVDIVSASDTVGANAQAYQSNDTFAQRFELIPAGGYFALRAVNSGRYLHDAGELQGSNVVQGSLGPSLPSDEVREGGAIASELWNVFQTQGGYVFCNIETGRYLTLSGANICTQALEGIEQLGSIVLGAPEASVFKIAKSTPSLASNYYAVYTPAGNAIDVAGASYKTNANIQLYRDNSTSAQRFRVETMASGYFKITNIYNKKALHILAGNDIWGTSIQQYPDNGSSAQRFYPEPSGDGWFYLRTVAANYLASSSDASSENIFVGTKDVAQKFRFRAVGYSLPSSAFADAPYESQTAIRAWNGCESASAAMLLRSQGVNTNTSDFIMRVPITGNPYTGYTASPYLSGGNIELFPSGIMGPMNSYGVTAVDLSSVSFDRLKEYLATGRPVVVWASWEWKGIHVCCVYGYTQDRVYYHDPYYGASKSMSISDFLAQWAWYRNYAVSVN